MSSIIRYASLATLALSLAACGNGGPNAVTAISTATASPPAATAARPQSAALVAPAASSGTTPAEFVTGTLCTRPDQVVFSCPLEKTNKIVSICAAGNTAPHRFYYAFGKTNAPELLYPSEKNASSQSLNRTSLIFAGGTGGVALSFHKSDYEYITFMISGKGFRNDGVMVRHDHDRNASLHLTCNPKNTYETKNDNLYGEIFKLRPEPDLKYGLPYYPPKESQ